jgi:hypothetical protein
MFIHLVNSGDDDSLTSSIAITVWLGGLILVGFQSHCDMG